MSFSTNVLSTTAECDVILNIATKEKRGLQYKKSSLDKQKESFSDTSTLVDQDLTEIDAKVLALQTIVATLPKATGRKKIKPNNAEARQTALAHWDKNYTNVALLSLELDLERVQKETDAIDQFIADINAKKVTL